MRTSRTAFAVIVLVIVGLSAIGASRADAAFVVDQQQTTTNSGGGAVAPSWTSFGQSFTPSLSSIQWAQFSLENQSSPFTPISLSLSVLNGVSGTNGLGGAVLATSPAVSLTSTAAFAPTLFQLSSPLALTPGNSYVLEVNILTQNQGLGWQQTSNDTYPGGQMLQSPYSTSILSGQDYLFSEGVIGSVPEPSSALALVIAGGMAGLCHRRRRRAA